MTQRKRSLEEALETCGPAAKERLAPYLQAAGFLEPPRALRFIALKDEGWLEVWGLDGGQRLERGLSLEGGPSLEGGWRAIRRYPILAASGGPGPKLKEGDGQVPEGRYPLTLLNHNSVYHLSIRIGYPGREDLAQAAQEGRSDLGGDIMLHGGARSVGCLALGDPAIEELFALTAAVGLDDSEILIAPLDLRHREAQDPRQWVRERYAALAESLKAMPRAAWPKE